MTEYSPVFLAAFFLVVCFLFAMQKGVAGLIASGMAAAAGMATLMVGVEWLPRLAKSTLDAGLGWKASAGISATLAVLIFLVIRIGLAFVFKRLFNPDSFLHRYVDGLPGGILSIGPSLVAIFCFFTFLRAAGTVQELNYVDSLARDGIAKMGGRIPPYPASAAWRNAVESVPFLAPFLDLTDPVSRRSARHAAALVNAQEGQDLVSFMRSNLVSAKLASAPQWSKLLSDGEVSSSLARYDRIGLVLAPAIQQAGADPAFRSELNRLDLREVLEAFVASLPPMEVIPDEDDIVVPGLSEPIAPGNALPVRP